MNLTLTLAPTQALSLNLDQVFIGKQLDQSRLVERFNACLATPENMEAKVAPTQTPTPTLTQRPTPTPTPTPNPILTPTPTPTPTPNPHPNPDPNPHPKPHQAARLRFGVGDKVLCNTGDGWSRGEVVGLMYRDDVMPPGVVAPYQIQLDGDDVSPAL